MPNHFTHISRCLPKASRPLQRLPKTISLAFRSYALEAAAPALSGNCRSPLEPAPNCQSPETTHSDYKTPKQEDRGTKEEENARTSAPSPPISLRTRPQRLPVKRSQKLSSSTASRGRLRLVRQEFLQKPGINDSFGFRIRQPRQRRPLPIAAPRISLRSATNTKYFRADREVSLGSWGDVPADRGSRTLTHGIDIISSVWNKQFMRLEKGLSINVWFTKKNLKRGVRKYTPLHMSRNDLHRSWMYLPRSQQLRYWQDTMLSCMQDSPKRALMTLIATLKVRAWRPPRHMVQDCLHFITRHFLFDASEVDPAALDAIWRLKLQFVEGASPEGSRSYAMSQDVVQLLLKHCDDVHVLLLYRRLVSNRANLFVNTALHFLVRFVDMGKLNLSMELLGAISRSRMDLSSDQIQRSRSRIDLSSDQIQSNCVKLLRTSWGLGEPYPVQSKILTQMLEMGIRPNTQMYNVILLNMIEGRDFETAWQTYDIAKQSESFEIDSITRGILLKGAKLSGDSSILEKVLHETDEDRSMLQDLGLVRNLLHTIGAFSPGDEFSSMLKFYRCHLDLRPLWELGLCGPETQAPEGQDVDTKWPTKDILAHLIVAYNKSHQSSEDLIHKYNLYWDCVQMEHPLIAPLARDTYVANSFLMAFGKQAETLQHCTTVVKHMLSLPPSPKLLPYAIPTVQTWSILIAAYFRHHQKYAAEKVLSMMRARGLRPDIITWDIILGGYADMQDIEGVVGAMRRRVEEGFENNTQTLKGLRRFRNRALLLDTLRASMNQIPEQSSPNVVIKAPVDPDEVEAMAKGWETDMRISKEEEVRRYLESRVKKL